MDKTRKQDWSKRRNCHCYCRLCRYCVRFVTERKNGTYSTGCRLNRYSKGFIADILDRFKH